MKAKILNNYGLINKGTIFQIVEFEKSRCTLFIDNKKVDFGLNEIEVIYSESEQFEIGRQITHLFSGFAIRTNDIEKEIKNLKFPLSKKLMRKCVYRFLS